MGWYHVSKLWQYSLKNNGPRKVVPSKERDEENVKTVIVEEPLHGAQKVYGTIRNTDHMTTVRWSDIVKNGGPGSIGDEMSSKEKSS